MQCRGLRWLCALVILASGGCATSARLVKWDQDGGVVAIPKNSNDWPSRYRDQAEAVMQNKCPRGYEVIREEEVPIGQTTHMHSDNDTKAPPASGGGDSRSINDITTTSQN